MGELKGISWSGWQGGWTRTYLRACWWASDIHLHGFWQTSHYRYEWAMKESNLRLTFHFGLLMIIFKILDIRENANIFYRRMVTKNIRASLGGSRRPITIHALVWRGSQTFVNCMINHCHRCNELNCDGGGDGSDTNEGDDDDDDANKKKIININRKINNSRDCKAFNFFYLFFFYLIRFVTCLQNWQSNNRNFFSSFFLLRFLSCF